MSMTARNIVISSGIVKNCGWKMPLRATSIMPEENITPASMPRLAITMITVRGATLDPIDELRKLTASLLTPTIRSDMASAKRTTIANSNMFTSVVLVDQYLGHLKSTR